jgi:hypothetical protein
MMNQMELKINFSRMSEKGKLYGSEKNTGKDDCMITLAVCIMLKTHPKVYLAFISCRYTVFKILKSKSSTLTMNFEVFCYL